MDKVKYSQQTPAQQLRNLLLRANLSQRAAARELGVDERTMRYWCAGEHDPPNMAILALDHLASMQSQVREDALGVSEPAGRSRKGDELREIYSMRIEPSVAEYLRALGGDNISEGIAIAARFHQERTKGRK